MNEINVIIVVNYDFVTCDVVYIKIIYIYVYVLYIHKRFLCGKEPPIKCQFSEHHRVKLKGNLEKHITVVYQITLFVV